VASNSKISEQDLRSLQFSVSVSQKDNPLKYLNSLNQFGSDSYFTINTASINRAVDNVLRTDVTTISPSWVGVNSPIFVNATGVHAELKVTPGVYLSTDDFTGIANMGGLSDPYYFIQSNKILIGVTPLTPLLDFKLKVNSPALSSDIYRFEFSLSDLSWTELKHINYLKELPSGKLQIFNYISSQSDPNYGTGARLEVLTASGNGNYEYIPLQSEDQLKDNSVYLALYIKDNGRGDDNNILGQIDDPGAPAYFSWIPNLKPTDFTIIDVGSLLAFTLPDQGAGKTTVNFSLITREAAYDNIVNFYQVFDAETGAIQVTDGNGQSRVVRTSESDYISLATRSSNSLYQYGSDMFPNIAISNLHSTSRKTDFDISEGWWIPYVKVKNTGKTYGPYNVANDDKFAHFGASTLITGADTYQTLWIEDLPGGGDKDYNDLKITYLKPN
jgi:hypothetical protein